MPLMGRAAQRNGVRATLIAAAAMVTFGSVLAALGPSLLVIVIGRLIGGLAAGPETCSPAVRCSRESASMSSFTW
jgi:MFS family permease